MKRAGFCIGMDGVCSRETADYIVNNAPCVSRRVLSSCHVPDRQAMHNFAHKGVIVSVLPKQAVAATGHASRPAPAQQPWGSHMPHGGGFYGTQPAGTDVQGTLAAKRIEGKLTR